MSKKETLSGSQRLATVVRAAGKAVDVDVVAYVRPTHEVMNFIREWRTKAELSIDALGKAAGLSGSMISQLERGKATYTQNSLTAIAKALGVQPWQLLAGPPEENEELWKHVLAVALPGTDLTRLYPSNRITLQSIVRANCNAAIETARELKLLEEQPSV